MTPAAAPADRLIEEERARTQPPRVPESNRRSPWQLLRQHDFRSYFVGSLISNLGTWLQSTAQVLIAYKVTHSVFTVGLITSAQFAGIILVSPWAPVLADRFGLRAVLISSQSVSAVIAACMAWRYLYGTLDVHSLLVGALGLGLAYALALPLQTAVVPKLVDKQDVTAAFKMNSVSYNAGRALAPALCVLVIAFVGPDLIFTFNAISFVIFAVLLRRLERIADATSLRTTIAVGLRRLSCVSANVLPFMASAADPSSVKKPASSEFTEAPPGRPRARVSDGIIIALRHHRRILLLLAIVAAVTLADDPILVLSPAVAHTKLHVSTEWAAYFIAALGWGSVLGSMPPAPAINDGTQRASKLAAIALLFLGISVVVFTIGFSIRASLIAAIAAGAAGLITGTAAQTALLRHQKKTAANVATVTSVAALWAIAWAGTKPFASFLDGWLASHIGIVPTSITLAAPAVTIALCELLLPKGARRSIDNCGEWITSRVIPRLNSPEFIFSDTDPPPSPNSSAAVLSLENET